ncbi:HepT-like ribonuclease domain-containing protein [uncultured Methanofollis sp.]|uniref:HepT-like ribonuclease domain-containing protein n=1 Tax=uncultured Methanofollis sp. TaxID=262500 RepID=UPI003182FC89
MEGDIGVVLFHPIKFFRVYPPLELRIDAVPGMRDKLIHQYFGVDIGIVRETARTDLLRFRNQVETILSEIS